MKRLDAIPDYARGLRLYEVLDYYDGPLFFSCRDSVGQLYVFYWADRSESEDLWLSLKISSERYTGLKRGTLPIAQCLSDPEDGRIYLVHEPLAANAPTPWSVDEMFPTEIDFEWLPESDDVLELSASRLPDLSASALEAARGQNSDIIDIALGETTAKSEIQCGSLGRVLDSVQNLLYAIAYGSTGAPKRIPEGTKRKVNVAVTEVFAGSFGVRLQPEMPPLLVTDESEKYYKALAQLVQVAQNRDHLQTTLHGHNVLTRTRFRHLLTVLADSELSISTNWSDPRGEYVDAHASSDDIRRSLETLEADGSITSETNTYSCRLVGVDVERNFFAVVLDDDSTVRGELNQELETRHFEIPSNVRATIEETCTVDRLTDREKWSYRLLELHDLNSSPTE